MATEGSQADIVALRRRAALGLHATFLAIAIAILLAAVVLRVDSEGSIAAPWGAGSQSLPPLCVFQRFLGIDCPGCGLTRCFVSAAHGNWAQAWQFHPVGLVLFAVAIAQLPYRSWQITRLLRGQPEISSLAWAPWLAGLIMILLLGQWVVRMIV